MLQAHIPERFVASFQHLTLKSSVVNQNGNGRKNDPDVADGRPAIQVLEVGLKPAAQVSLRVGRAPQAANLRQAGQAGLERVPKEITRVDFPEPLLASQRTDRMRARPDNAHVAAQNVQQLRQFVDAGLADEAADASDPIIILACRSRTDGVELFNPH